MAELHTRVFEKGDCVSSAHPLSGRFLQPTKAVPYTDNRVRYVSFAMPVDRDSRLTGDSTLAGARANTGPCDDVWAPGDWRTLNGSSLHTRSMAFKQLTDVRDAY